MDEDLRKTIRALGYISIVGIAMALSIAIGALIGHYLDNRFGSQPWLTLIGLGVGIAAAFRNLYILYKRAKDFQ
jgi:ATP synthase protein I